MRLRLDYIYAYCGGEPSSLGTLNLAEDTLCAPRTVLDRSVIQDWGCHQHRVGFCDKFTVLVGQIVKRQPLGALFRVQTRSRDYSSYQSSLMPPQARAASLFDEPSRPASLGATILSPAHVDRYGTNAARHFLQGN